HQSAPPLPAITPRPAATVSSTHPTATPDRPNCAAPTPARPSPAASTTAATTRRAQPATASNPPAPARHTSASAGSAGTSEAPLCRLPGGAGTPAIPGATIHV